MSTATIRRDPGVRATWTATVVLAVITTVHGHRGHAPILGDVLFPDRLSEVGLIAAGVAGGIVGAGMRQHGTARARWCAGDDRSAVLRATLGPAARAAAIVPVIWWITALTATAVTAGAPSAAASPPVRLLQALVWMLAAAALSGATGSLVGFLAGRTWRAVAIVAASSLAFTSDALGLLGSPPAAVVALSPLGAVRGLCVAGTGTVLTGMGVDRADTAVLAIAAGAWLLTLGAWCIRLPLVAVPSSRPVPRPLITSAVVLGLLAAGYLGPATTRAGVAWQMGPRWRHAVADRRSSLQIADAWLDCRRAHPTDCRRYERPGGVSAPAAALAQVDQSLAHHLPTHGFLVDPRHIVATLEIPPFRSGHAVVDRAGVALTFVSDRHGGYLLAQVEGPAMGISGP